MLGWATEALELLEYLDQSCLQVPYNFRHRTIQSRQVNINKIRSYPLFTACYWFTPFGYLDFLSWSHQSLARISNFQEIWFFSNNLINHCGDLKSASPIFGTFIFSHKLNHLNCFIHKQSGLRTSRTSYLKSYKSNYMKSWVQSFDDDSPTKYSKHVASEVKQGIKVQDSSLQ